jgi:hypothetical protein
LRDFGVDNRSGRDRGRRGSRLGADSGHVYLYAVLNRLFLQSIGYNTGKGSGTSSHEGESAFGTVLVMVGLRPFLPTWR